MKGLELCKRYYAECVKPIMDKSCGSLSNQYSCALIGWGSDVTGNDDELSRDHEWGPRLYLFLQQNMIGFKQQIETLLREYVPDEFLGYKTRFAFCENIGARVPANNGSLNIEINTYEGYITAFLGVLKPQNHMEWLMIPENKLFEITAGEIFYDYHSILENKLAVYKEYYPTDVWKYRLAYLWQSIAWNYDLIGLCNKRNDKISAYIALNKIVVPIVRLLFALNRKYAPSYTKWIGTELYKLPNLSKDIGALLEACICNDGADNLQKTISLIFQKLISLQNSHRELPKINIEKPAYNRGFMEVDCQKIADAIYTSIEGMLKDVPLYGAPDQYITNEDYLLDANLIRKFQMFYGSI